MNTVSENPKLSKQTKNHQLNLLLNVNFLQQQLKLNIEHSNEVSIKPELIKILKKIKAEADDGLKAAYQNGVDVELIVFGRASLCDCLINAIFQQIFKAGTQQISLIAVGGYGRGELHPKSDIDLMLLLEEKENKETKNLIEIFLMLLWDIGLEIGHSTRTIDECVMEATKDITINTNIMEARLLTGSTTLFDTMKKKTSQDVIWDSKSFFQAKLEEQIQRSGKFNDTAYNLEPNIKESRGGLRDIQMITWVAKRHFNIMHLGDLVKQGFLVEDELEALQKGQHLLWRIRCSLHYLANRREDRLLFEYQRDLASEFGFNDSSYKKNEAIEQFMQQYYRTVIELERLNEMLLQHFREAIIYSDVEAEAEQINDSFQVKNGYLESIKENLFKENPCAIFEMFLLLQDYHEIQGVRAATIRQVKKHRYLIDDNFRKSPRAQQLFIKIMTHSRGVIHELRRMNRYGILAAYIPAFDSIVGRMQYDLFHAYTVDQHTLFVIRNMRRFSVPEFCHEFPLASGIFQHLKKPALLYIAGLFHDIAKGRLGNHSELGAVDAKQFCQTHSLPKKDTELVHWLVKSHLVMSMTAQRKDLSDPDVISEFSSYIKTLERLDYLYLLTISDIRATNPKQWNNWKDKLFSELYNKTAVYLNNDVSLEDEKETNILNIQTHSLRQLDLMGINTHDAHDFWDLLNNDYFQGNTTGEIVWHTQLIYEATQNNNLEVPLIKARIDELSNSIELLIYMKDRQQIFYDVVSTLNNSQVDVVNAKIINASNGYALEIFRLIPVNFGNAEMELASQQITDNLQLKLRSENPIQQTNIKASIKHRYFTTPTTVRFNSIENNATQIIIETIDRSGVLTAIAKTFIDFKLKILNARISTAGEKAIDTFIVSSENNLALNTKQKNQFKKHLKELL